MSDIDDQTNLDASQGLFSTVASDNVELVGQASSRASEGLWTVAPKADSAAQADAGSQEESGSQTHSGGAEDWSTADPSLQDSSDFWTEVSDDQDSGFDDFSDSQTSAEPDSRQAQDSLGSVFSADPVDHFDDAIDEAEVIDNGAWLPPVVPEQSNPLFSSGPERTSQPPYATPIASAEGSQDDLWEPRQSDRPDWETFAAPSQASAAQPTAAQPQSARRASGGVTDFESAVLRLRPEDAEAAHVALSVCGALLPAGEGVVALLTGQMLGRPAAVLVTEYRVVIANDRRWTPVIDVFAINADLTVRGRQDRDIAALSFSDRNRVSMVDGITEVAMAIELANLIRGAGEQSGW
ncbi:unannotated protein [freshwater metagenome]|uniref:Unannotated protein n=1 Tax=freshwater metagenome TaxID=449393 RepID=A0A6J7M8W8_9ZZZZ|nr:hypothetical protein [Actinomycetota bacterium]MSX74616.1 hypothetical protein [Actinomycetota bacterium]